MTVTSKPARRRHGSPQTIADQMAETAQHVRSAAELMRTMTARNAVTKKITTLPPYPLSALIDALNELSDAYDGFGDMYGFKKYSRIIDYMNDHAQRVAALTAAAGDAL